MRSDHPFLCHKLKGSALIVILIILGLAAALLVSALKSNPQVERDKITADALAKAKDALIGYAVSPTGGGQRPGDLLRPDNFASTETPPDYNGKSETGCMDATKANGLPLISGGPIDRQNLRCLGRLPWVDMNISLAYADENDPAGIMPWYAVSANLVDPVCLAILNSDIVTLPQPTLNADATHSYAIPTCAAFPNLPTQLPHPWLTVRDEKGNVLSNRVAAVIIIPGPPLAGQTRPPSPNLAGPAAYLDSITVAGITYSNADLDNDFIQAPPSDTFNDKVLFITIDELMAAVEKRAAAEAGNALKTFYSTCGFYPKPVDFLNSSCYTGTCTSDTSKTQGRFPYSPKPAGATTYPDWTLPPWFDENRWDAVIYYAISDGFKSGGDGTTLLAVDGNASARALFFTPAANTPLINRVVTPTTLANYLLTAENANVDAVFTFNNTKEKGYQRKNDPSALGSPSAPNPICGCPSGQALPWTQGSANCSATTSAGFDTNTATLSSTAPGTTGSATAICNVGVWQLNTTPAPTCSSASGCPAGPISWTQGSTNCSATTSTGSNGSTAVLSSTAPGTTGSATAICNVNTWQLTASTCSLPSTGGGGVYTGIVPPTVSQNPGWTGNTGLNSVTLSDGTIITVTSTSGSTPTIYVSNTGIGVASGSGPKSLDLGNGEQMSFTFTGGQQSLAILVGMLKNNDLGYITFKNNGATVGTATLQGCTSSNTSMFSNIVPAGNPTFNQVILTSGTSNGYYINQVAACATGTCAITGSGATGASLCSSWASP